MENCKNLEDNMLSSGNEDNIEVELSKLSCPFTWNLDPAAKHYLTVSTLAQSQDDNIDEEAYELLEQFIAHLVFFYERIVNNEIERALIKLKDAENVLKEMREKEEERDIMKTIEHVFNATICHYYFKVNKIKELQIILPSIIKVIDLNGAESAALIGCQCIAWSTYVDYGVEQTIYFAKEAIKQDPNKALWHFIFAKSLRRLRRANNFYTKPSEDEKKHFELAYEKRKNPIFAIYLAQMYHELHKTDEQGSLKQDLFDLYEIVFLGCENNYKILLKVALGCMRLGTCNAVKLAKQCLDLVGEIVPNNSTYFHYRGIYSFKYGDSNESIQYLKKACDLYNFVAEEYYVFVGWKLGIVDPINHIQLMLSKYSFQLKERVQQMHLNLATCYYMKKDMKNALEHYLKAVEMYPHNFMLKDMYVFLDFNTKSYRSGIYSFLKQKFLIDVKNCEEYKQQISTFMDSYYKLKDLCQVHGNRFINNNKLLSEQESSENKDVEVK